MKPDNKKRRKGKRRPNNYYKNWEQKSKLKSKHFKACLKEVKKWVDGALKDTPGLACLKAALILWIMMKRYNFSLRVMMDELRFRPGALRIVGLDWYPSKSWLHKWLGRPYPGMLDELILFTAGEDAFGTLSVDSTHHQFNRYVLVNDARRGEKWVHDTVKHHAPISPGGKVVSSVVTDGKASDSPVPAALCAKAPRGSGCPLGEWRLPLP